MKATSKTLMLAWLAMIQDLGLSDDKLQAPCLREGYRY